METWLQRDREWYLWCYHFAEAHLSFQLGMDALTKLSSKIFFLIYGLGAVELAVFHQGQLLAYLGLPALTLGLVTLLRKLVNRPRPFDALSLKPSVSHESGGSFPSKHSASAMIIALSFLWAHPIGVLPLVTLAFLTGISRVFAGVHYPLDVLAGQLLALIVFASGIWLF